VPPGSNPGAAPRFGHGWCPWGVTVRLAVLGDSIGWGQGAARERDPLGPRLADGLAMRGVDAALRVFAVPGARSRGLATQVDVAVEWRPNLVLVVIGANDLTHLEPVDSAVAALAGAVRRLRGVGAEVVVAPAPDLSAIPHVPVFLREVVRDGADYYRQRQVEVVVAAGGRLADPDQRASRAFVSDPRLFCSDRFHPSSAGYAVIADAVLPALLEAADSLDQAS
jgi:lysophospholipase L1-like esterase